MSKFLGLIFGVADKPIWVPLYEVRAEAGHLNGKGEPAVVAMSRALLRGGNLDNKLKIKSFLE